MISKINHLIYFNYKNFFFFLTFSFYKKKVGKTSIIKDLVKYFTRQNISEPKGPITVITGKKRRITLIEVPLDMASMADISKVADLVLMVVDAKYGFEIVCVYYFVFLIII